MNTEKIQGSRRQRRVKNQMFHCNKVCKESCSARCHIWTLEDSVADERISRSLFWHELQVSDSHEELNRDFVLLSQADRLLVHLSSTGDSTFAYRACAAPPCSGYFRWLWAKGKPRETGRLCIPEKSFPDAGHRGGLQECKFRSSRATGEDMREKTQLHVCSQQGLYLKFWSEPGFLSSSATSFAHLPSAASFSLSISAACSSLPSGSAGALTHSVSHTETQNNI